MCSFRRHVPGHSAVTPAERREVPGYLDMLCRRHGCGEVVRYMLEFHGEVRDGHVRVTSKGLALSTDSKLTTCTAPKAPTFPQLRACVRACTRDVPLTPLPVVGEPSLPWPAHPVDGHAPDSLPSGEPEKAMVHNDFNNTLQLPLTC